MKLHPFYQCERTAFKARTRYRAVVFQQFLCAVCGAKQTMSEPNRFFKRGVCERCGVVTDIRADGCNFVMALLKKRTRRPRLGPQRR